MKNIFEMRRQLAAKKDEARALLKNEKRSKEEADQLDALLTEIEDRAAEIDQEVRAQEALGFHTGSGRSAAGVGGQAASPSSRIMIGPERRMAEVFLSADGSDEGLSLAKFILGHVNGEWRNASREQAAYRAAQSGNIGSLGGIVVPNAMSNEIIDLARAQTRVIQAGARTIPMQTRGLTIPTVIGDATAQWRAEATQIVPSVVTFGERNLEAHTLAALVKAPIEMLQDSPLAEEVIRNSLAQQLALGMDYASLFGTGIGAQPLGLYNWPAEMVNYVDLGENGQQLEDYAVPYAPFSLAAQRVAEANGNANAVIYSPRTAFELDRTVDGNGNPMMPLPSFERLNKFDTTQIPNDLVFGNATTASAAFVGQWDQLGIGIRENIQIDVAREADDDFGKMMISIRAYLRADVIGLKPKHFSIIRGILPSDGLVLASS